MLRILALFVISLASVNAGRPVFEKRVEDMILEPHVKSQLLCNASGDEPMDYRWYDEHSEEIDSNRNQSIYSSLTEGGSYLVMEDPAPFNGSFTCAARNVHGISTKIFMVYIFGSGYPIIKNVSILNITDSSVVLSVSISKNTESLLINYREEQDRTSKSRKILTSGGVLDSVIELNDLVPGGKYSFQLQALSMSNESPQWLLKDVILLPSPPELIFLNLHEGSVKIQWFKKSDDIRRETILDYTITYGSVHIRSGNYWEHESCNRTIILPSCAFGSHTISDLSKSIYYEVQVKARTATGYGQPSKFKVYIQ